MGQRFYGGPSVEELHERYAKEGRTDAAAPVRAVREVRIEAPPARVWAVLSDPAGWHAIDPAIHDVRLAAPVGVDARFTWANGKAKIASRFAVVDREREITWTGVSMGARVVHRHLLTPMDGGEATLLRTEESMAGWLLGLLFSAAKLETVLADWLAAVKSAAERP
ncbi:SRPBCC family protein [Streptomyces sp. NPDC051976]|uniref:SRPBCC family protein n=1 Tax=Streptomyces sp. NPDC051976 TaxID=3154947 RepID=UPI00342D2DA0